MAAVVADTRPRKSWRQPHGVQSGGDLRTHWNGVGPLEYDDHPGPRVSSRNDHAIAGGAREALVDATVQRKEASNRMKLGSTAVRNSVTRRSRLKCDGHFTRPPTPGRFSPR